MFKIVDHPISSDALFDAVTREYNGAVVTFSGVVRNNSAGQQTQHLVYEAYKQMAERSMAEIGATARERFQVEQIAVLHRVGRLEIGEISVLIAVGSPHRSAAFQACEFVIDQLKKRVPIWKKEVGADGAYWVEGPQPTALQV